MNRRVFATALGVAFTIALVLWLATRAAGPSASSPVQASPAPAAKAASSANAPDADATPPAPKVGEDENELSPTLVPAGLASELARLLALADPDERFRRLDEFWRRWFAQDRAGVFAAIAGLPSGDERAQALSYTLLELAAEEPDRALELALRLVSDQQDAHLFASLFDAFARSDLALARERLARVPPGPGFDPAWRAYTDAYARAHLDEALAWARELPAGPARTLALETALYSLAEKDPFAAFDVAMQTLGGEARDRSLHQALGRIIPHDPAGAAALIVAMPSSPWREISVVDAARAWADDAPGLALSWASSLPPESASAATLATANILEIWIRRDRAAALSAFDSLPLADARPAAAERVATVLALESPGDALSWAASLTDTDAREHAITASVATWARQDPAGAAAWTLSTDAGPDQGALFGEVLSHWAVQDLPAAASYVRSVGDATAQQAGALALAPYLARQDPLAALDWARKLPRAEARTETIRAIHRQWLANDPASARAWAASAEAPAGL